MGEQKQIKGGLFRPPCAECGVESSMIEIIPAHELPQEWSQWSAERQESFREYRNQDYTYLLYSGPGGSNGNIGDRIDDIRAARIVEAIYNPAIRNSILSAEFHDGAGLCDECSEFYCPQHWSLSRYGNGFCPKKHLKSLDPHWSPDDDD